MADFNDVLDEINEQRKYSRAGFTRGYSMGEEAGWREGFLFGLKKGASLATEIGFYQGYTTAWLTLLEKQEQGKARKIQALKSLLEMARSFPLEEQLLQTSAAPQGKPSRESGVGGQAGDGSSLIARLAKIRAKFKQVQGLLQAGSYATMPAGMSAATHHHQPHHQMHHHQTSHHASSGHPHFAATSSTSSGYSSAHFQQQMHHQTPHQPQWHHPHQVPLNRTRSPIFRDASFDSRTSGGQGDHGPNEMSF